VRAVLILTPIVWIALISKCCGDKATYNYNSQPPLTLTIAHDTPLIQYSAKHSGGGVSGDGNFP
jgi:hypothetical protein